MELPLIGPHGREGRETPVVSRSQAILRMPVDMVVATVVMHDGERFEAMLFVPTGDGVARLLDETEPFVPVVKHGRTCLVVRTAIAAIGVPKAIVDLEDALPLDRQRVSVKLRSGSALDGELAWCSDGQHRTKDYLNASPDHFELHTDELTFHVLVSHVATVTEC